MCFLASSQQKKESGVWCHHGKPQTTGMKTESPWSLRDSPPPPTVACLGSRPPVWLLFSSSSLTPKRQLAHGLLYFWWILNSYSKIDEEAALWPSSVLFHCPLVISLFLCIQLRGWTEGMKGYDLSRRRFCFSLEVLVDKLVIQHCSSATRFEKFHLLSIATPSPMNINSQNKLF